MKKIMVITLALAAAFCLGFISKPEKETMKVGAFSISLSVKDLKASKEFYENMGFTELGGDRSRSYLIMKSKNALIGLFHGMLE